MRHWLNCAYCYTLGVAELAWDRYGRPMVSCRACGARTFTRSPKGALRGIYMTSRLVEATVRKVESDPAELAAREQEADDFVREIQAAREALANGVPAQPVRQGANGEDHGQVVPTAAAGK